MLGQFPDFVPFIARVECDFAGGLVFEPPVAAYAPAAPTRTPTTVKSANTARARAAMDSSPPLHALRVPVNTTFLRELCEVDESLCNPQVQK